MWLDEDYRTSNSWCGGIVFDREIREILGHAEKPEARDLPLPNDSANRLLQPKVLGGSPFVEQLVYR
jgi:hypothetical protein